MTDLDDGDKWVNSGSIPEFDDDGNPIVADEEEEDDDFSELDAMLAEATAATEEEKRLKAARKRLVKVSRSNHPNAESERNELLATIRTLEEGRVWLTVGRVALFHTQTCQSCTHTHALFMGWFGEQRHTSDPNARRLLAGKPVEFLPERREDHYQGGVEFCSDCVESCLAINVALKEAPEEV